MSSELDVDVASQAAHRWLCQVHEAPDEAWGGWQLTAATYRRTIASDAGWHNPASLAESFESTDPNRHSEAEAVWAWFTHQRHLSWAEAGLPSPSEFREARVSERDGAVHVRFTAEWAEATVVMALEDDGQWRAADCLIAIAPGTHARGVPCRTRSSVPGPPADQPPRRR